MPKARITREMVVEAAFTIARREGGGRISARSVARELNCSTQPILYCFSSVEELRQAAFQRAEAFHTAYFLDVQGAADPLLEMALRYVRFGQEEKHLFRFLFQSDLFCNRELESWGGDGKLRPVIDLIAARGGFSREQAEALFLSIYLCMHGYASMFATNSMVYDEKEVAATLRRTFTGMASAMKAGMIQ